MGGEKAAHLSLTSQQSKLFSGLKIYQLWDLAKFHLHFVYFSTWHRLTGFGFPSLNRNDLFQAPNWPLLAKLTVSEPTFFLFVLISSTWGLVNCEHATCQNSISSQASGQCPPPHSFLLTPFFSWLFTMIHFLHWVPLRVNMTSRESHFASTNMLREVRRALW